MKLKVHVKALGDSFVPKFIDKGEWVDLKALEDVNLIAPQAGVRLRKMNDGVVNSYRNVWFDSTKIHLGVAMKLPAGFEAMLLPRSSTFGKYGIMLANNEGVIDNTYSGPNDYWLFNAVAFKETTIPAGSAIAQFRIQLSQRATVWQKFKWLFCTGIEFIRVEELEDTDRGGFGSTD